MTHTLAMNAVWLTSIPKIVLCLGVLWLWGKWATAFDKDAAYYNLNRRMWNLIQVLAAAVGFAVIFFVPLFFISFPLGVAIICGAAYAYFNHRNSNVPDGKEWALSAGALGDMFKGKSEDEKAAAKASLRFVKPPQGLKAAPGEEDPQYVPHMGLEPVIDQALRRKAQRIDMAASESQFVCQISVDGVEQRIPAASVSQGVAMIDYLKAQCGMDVSDRRKKQIGKCKIENDEFGAHELRVSTAGSTRGITATIIIDPAKQLAIPFEQLGFLDSQLEALKPVFEGDRGVVLIASPSKQGRTTTFYNLVAKHDPYVLDIHIFEPEPEREMEGITHHVVDPSEVKRRLESLLLRDPHVVGIANLTDPELAQTIARASLEGKRFYAGLKAEDTFTALKIWVKAVGDLDLASRSITAVVSQRLMRKLCEFCRQKYKPDPGVLRKLNLPPDKIPALYKAGGRVIVKKDPEICPVCAGIGYQGRIAAYEVMVIDDTARSLIKSGKLDELRAHLRRQKMMWLSEAALSRAVSGVTSISEVNRATGEEQEAAAASA